MRHCLHKIGMFSLVMPVDRSYHSGTSPSSHATQHARHRVVAAASGSLSRLLPHPRTRHIGRTEEIARGRAFLLEEASPLLSLTGPGGVGKTRLALIIAHDVSSTFADGVAWIDLARLASPAFVAATLAKALDIVASPDLRSRMGSCIISGCDRPCSSWTIASISLKALRTSLHTSWIVPRPADPGNQPRTTARARRAGVSCCTSATARA